MRTTSTLLIILAATACSKGGSSKQAAPELAAVNGPYAAEFSGFDATAVAKKLQGTWVFKGNMDKPYIWSIEGTKVTEVDGDGKTLVGQLEVASPCTLEMKLPDGSGHPYGFVFDGDNLHIGLGDSGTWINGSTGYACSYPSLIRKTGDKCEIEAGNKSEGGKLSYMWEPTECKDDGKTFSAKDRFGRDVKLEIFGTMMYDEQMKGSAATKVADLAAAKSKQADLLAKK